MAEKSSKELALTIGGKKVEQYEITNVPQMATMATILKAHIVKQNLYTAIQGKNYAHVEGWQFAGGLVGLFPRVVKVEEISPEGSGEKKWLAEVEIIERKSGNIISRGFGLCSNKEMKRATSDEYAILSMAQTRAIGKAYRNILGWVMKLAGYEATPREEMVKVGTETPVGAGKTPKHEKQLSYEQVFTFVARTEDPKRLAEIRAKVEKSSFTAEQKDQILRLIDAKIPSKA